MLPAVGMMPLASDRFLALAPAMTSPIAENGSVCLRSISIAAINSDKAVCLPTAISIRLLDLDPIQVTGDTWHRLRGSRDNGASGSGKMRPTDGLDHLIRRENVASRFLDGCAR